MHHQKLYLDDFKRKKCSNKFFTLKLHKSFLKTHMYSVLAI